MIGDRTHTHTFYTHIHTHFTHLCFTLWEKLDSGWLFAYFGSSTYHRHRQVSRCNLWIFTQRSYIKECYEVRRSQWKGLVVNNAEGCLLKQPAISRGTNVPLTATRLRWRPQTRLVRVYRHSNLMDRSTVFVTLHCIKFTVFTET